jgi:hypothetical protein
MAGRRIVITGISNHWATELARRLEHDPESRVGRPAITGPSAGEASGGGGLPGRPDHRVRLR